MLTVLAVFVAVIHGAALFGPPLADLLKRDDVRVGPWWFAPLAVVLVDGLLGFGFAAVRFLTPGDQLATGVMFALVGTAVMLDLACGLTAFGLAFVRGITPGGPTRRSGWGWLRLGIALLPIIGGPIAVFGLDADPLTVFWWVPTAWAVLFWVLAFARDGEPRLAQGGRTAAGLIGMGTLWLWAAPATLLLGMVMFGNVVGLKIHDLPWQIVAFCLGPPLVSLVTWSLTRPWPWWAGVAGFAWLPALLTAPVLQQLWFTTPPWIQPPELLDVHGWGAHPPVEWIPHDRPVCVELDGWRHGCATDGIFGARPTIPGAVPLLLQGELPMDALPRSPSVYRVFAWGYPVEVGTAAPTRARLVAVGPEDVPLPEQRVEIAFGLEPPQTYVLGDRDLPPVGSVTIEPKASWTLQDAVSVCLTLHADRCRLLPAP